MSIVTDHLKLINFHRLANGQLPLCLSSVLSSSAGVKARDLANNDYFAHTNPQGVTFQQLIANAGYDTNTYRGENIAAGAATAQIAFDQFRNSTGHNQQMLSPNFTEIGIAYVASGTYKTGVWVQHFGSGKTCSGADTAMPMKTTDKILSGPRGNPETAITNAASFGAKGPYAAFIREIHRLAPLMPIPIDPACAVAQSSQETNYWTTAYWTRDLNPGGVGITYEGEPSPFLPPYVQTGERAAALMLLEIWAHLYPPPFDNLPNEVKALIPVDKNWLAKVEGSRSDPNRPPVRILSDWCKHFIGRYGQEECVWACDPNYATYFVPRGNRLYGSGLADQGTTAPPPPPPASPNFSTNDKVRTNDDVRFRSSACTDGSVIDNLSQGTELCVTGGKRSGCGYDWYPVRQGGRDGFVAASFLTLATANGCAAPANPTYNVGDRAKPNVPDGQYINARSGPGLNYAALVRFSNQHQFCVTGGPRSGDGRTWYQLYSNSIAGYAWFNAAETVVYARNTGCQNNITPPSSSSLKTTDRVKATAQNDMRQGPGTTYAAPDTLWPDQQACIIDGPRSGSGRTWFDIRKAASGTTGWVDASKLALVTSEGCKSSTTPTSGRNLIDNPTAESNSGIRPYNGAQVTRTYFTNNPSNRFFKVIGSRGSENGGAGWATPSRLNLLGGTLVGSVDVRAPGGQGTWYIDGAWMDVRYTDGSRSYGRRLPRFVAPTSSWLKVNFPALDLDRSKRVDYARLVVLVIGWHGFSWYMDNADIHTK